MGKMSQESEKCIYRGKIRIEKKEWSWCYLFNAKLEDLNCEKCKHREVKTEQGRDRLSKQIV